MPTRNVTIASSVGLHARPAAMFVQAATETGLPITVARGGRAPGGARGSRGGSSGGAGHGDTVILEATGDGADEALDTLAELLSRDLDKA